MNKIQEDLLVYGASYLVTCATYASLIYSIQWGVAQGYFKLFFESLHK